MRVGLALLLLGASLAAGAGPAEATHDDDAPQYEFTSDPMPIGGTRYKAVLHAWANKGHPSRISVEIYETSNPDGRGFGRRSITFSHVGVFTSNEQLGAAKIDPTADQMGSHGNIDLTWTPKDQVVSTCGGRLRTRPGVFDGKFRFVATIDSERIEVSRSRVFGDLVADRGCQPGCPKESAGIRGTNDAGHTYVEASVGGTGPSAIARRDWLPTSSGWSTRLDVQAALPTGHVQVDADLAHGTLRGEPGTYVLYATDFDATAPAQQTGKVDCGGYYETWDAVTRTSTGTLTKAADGGAIEIRWINGRTSRWVGDGAKASRTNYENYGY